MKQIAVLSLVPLLSLGLGLPQVQAQEDETAAAGLRERGSIFDQSRSRKITRDREPGETTPKEASGGERSIPWRKQPAEKNQKAAEDETAQDGATAGEDSTSRRSREESRTVREEIRKSESGKVKRTDEDDEDADEDRDETDRSGKGSKKDKSKDKKGEKSLPPGLQKKLERGGELPPGWKKKI